MQGELFNQLDSQFRCGKLVLDVYAKMVTVAGKPFAVTPLEFNLLMYLVRHQSRPVPVKELLEAVWDCAEGGTANQVICCIKRLRKKLAEQGTPQYLHTLRGFGFRLCEPEKLPPPDGKSDEEWLTLFGLEFYPKLTRN